MGLHYNKCCQSRVCLIFSAETVKKGNHITHTKTGRKVQGIIYYKNDNGLCVLGLHRIPSEGGFWQPLTGTVEDGESYRDCLIRELKEETGIDEGQLLSVEGPINSFEWGRDDTLFKEEVYCVQVPIGTKIILSEEHDEHKWLTPKEAKGIFKFEEIKKGIDILLENNAN